jgi:hypothetical protein
MLTARSWWCVGRVVRSLYEELARSYALCFRELGMAENHAPTLRHYLLQDFAYSYRVWITLIKLLSAPLRYLKIDPNIHQGERLCGRLLPSVPRVPRRVLLGTPYTAGGLGIRWPTVDQDISAMISLIAAKCLTTPLPQPS